MNPSRPETRLDRLLADPLILQVMRADRVDPVALSAKLKSLARRLEERERGFVVFADGRHAPAAPRSAGSRLASAALCSMRTGVADGAERRFAGCGGRPAS